jgi:hypothetical protein
VFIHEPWDREQGVAILPALVCVSCGRYVGGEDLWGYLTTAPGDDDRVTPTFAYHVGRCAGRVEAAQRSNNWMLLDRPVTDELKLLADNLDDHPRPGVDGLVQPQRSQLDMRMMQRFLETLNSPLIGRQR